MTTPLPDLLAQVATLNDPKNPFTYEVKGNTIVGKWDIVSAKSLYPKEFRSIDKKFSITVELDEKKGTWKAKEKSQDSGGSISGGGISFGTSTNSFSGKSSNKSFGFELGGINTTKDGVSPILAWSFDSSKIKGPLFALLESNGWTKKKGLFG